MSEVHAHDAPRVEVGTAELGPVSVLDIGGDVGAVVVHVGEQTPSGELHACVRGRPAEHFHTGVHLRPVGDTEGLVAVFPEIVEGEYSLLDHDTDREHTPFTVVGGQVTTLIL